MSVYVGTWTYKCGRLVMSHMLADTVEELHGMADKIGVDRRHFQNKPRRPHYDIAQTKKSLAIGHGAILLDDREIIKKLDTK